MLHRVFETTDAKVSAVRGVTRSDGARGKKQVWRPHVRNWDLSEANLLYWKKYLWHCWNFSAFLAVNGRLGNYVPLRPSLRLWVWLCWETIRLYQRWETSDHAFHGNAIATNHAERAFPSCVETTARWRRFSKSLWRDVNQLCSSAKPQPFKYVWKMFSASRRKYTTGKYGTGLNGRGKLSKLRKMSLEMEAT